MLACNSIGLALRGPSYPPFATTCVTKREQRQYKILRVVYTNSNTVANKRQHRPRRGPGQRSSSECLPPTHHTYHPAACSAAPLAVCCPCNSVFFSVVPFRLQFLYCCKMFSFQRSYIYFANTHTHTKKLFVALLTALPPLHPLFSPLPACCKPSQLPALPCPAPSCRHCSLRLCRLY